MPIRTDPAPRPAAAHADPPSALPAQRPVRLPSHPCPAFRSGRQVTPPPARRHAGLTPRRRGSRSRRAESRRSPRSSRRSRARRYRPPRWRPLPRPGRSDDRPGPDDREVRLRAARPGGADRRARDRRRAAGAARGRCSRGDTPVRQAVTSATFARPRRTPLQRRCRALSTGRGRWAADSACTWRSGDEGGIRTAELDAARVAARVRAWAGRLTRHDESSDLMRANADPRPVIHVRPTLAAALRWAADASDLTGGDRRCDPAPRTPGRRVCDAAGEPAATPPASPRQPPARPRSPRQPRGESADRLHDLALRPFRPSGGAPGLATRGPGARGARLHRDPGVAFDLDGVAKGWIADRALALLDRHPGALVDADGDVAIRSAAGDAWEVGVADPRTARPGARRLRPARRPHGRRATASPRPGSASTGGPARTASATTSSTRGPVARPPRTSSRRPSSPEAHVRPRPGRRPRSCSASSRRWTSSIAPRSLALSSSRPTAACSRSPEPPGGWHEVPRPLPAPARHGLGDPHGRRRRRGGSHRAARGRLRWRTSRRLRPTDCRGSRPASSRSSRTSRSPGPSSTGSCSRRRSSTRSPIGRSRSRCTRTSPRSAWDSPASTRSCSASTRRCRSRSADMLVPFVAPYRPIWVGIGQLTLYLVAVVHGELLPAAPDRTAGLATAPLPHLPVVRRRDRARDPVRERQRDRLGLVELRRGHRPRRLPDRLPGRDRHHGGA